MVTQAYTESETEEYAGVRITAGSLTIRATDDYEFVGVAVSAAIGGTAGVGVTALLTIAEIQSLLILAKTILLPPVPVT